MGERMFVGSATSMPLSDSEFCLSPLLAINESPLLVICCSFKLRNIIICRLDHSPGVTGEENSYMYSCDCIWRIV